MIRSAALHAEAEEEVYNLSAASVADLSTWLQVSKFMLQFQLHNSCNPTGKNIKTLRAKLGK